MSDIVERLRKSAMPIDADIDPDAVADEIERLRETVRTSTQQVRELLEENANLKMARAEPVAWYDPEHGLPYGLTEKPPTENAVYLYLSVPVPEGWVMVPKEPTKAMYLAASDNQWLADPVLRATYKAMIAAAPKHLTVVGDQDGGDHSL